MERFRDWPGEALMYNDCNVHIEVTLRKRSKLRGPVQPLCSQSLRVSLLQFSPQYSRCNPRTVCIAQQNCWGWTGLACGARRWWVRKQGACGYAAQKLPCLLLPQQDQRPLAPSLGQRCRSRIVPAIQGLETSPGLGFPVRTTALPVRRYIGQVRHTTTACWYITPCPAPAELCVVAVQLAPA